jgi:hypothetical protein
MRACSWHCLLNPEKIYIFVHSFCRSFLGQRTLGHNPSISVLRSQILGSRQVFQAACSAFPVIAVAATGGQVTQMTESHVCAFSQTAIKLLYEFRVIQAWKCRLQSLHNAHMLL